MQYRVYCSIAEFCSAGRKRPIRLQYDRWSVILMTEVEKMCHTDVDMTEIFYCLYVVFVISGFVQYIYM